MPAANASPATTSVRSASSRRRANIPTRGVLQAGDPLIRRPEAVRDLDVGALRLRLDRHRHEGAADQAAALRDEERSMDVAELAVEAAEVRGAGKGVQLGHRLQELARVDHARDGRAALAVHDAAFAHANILHVAGELEHRARPVELAPPRPRARRREGEALPVHRHREAAAPDYPVELEVLAAGNARRSHREERVADTPALEVAAAADREAEAPAVHRQGDLGVERRGAKLRLR